MARTEAQREAARLKRQRKAEAKAQALAPTCIECSPPRVATLIGGAEIYPHRPDLHALWFWRCECGARVGCHKGTRKPLGSPAGPATQAARRAAHAAFDPLWKRKAELDMIAYSEARGAAYRWLGEQLGLAAEDCHIGMMDEATARRAVQAITDARLAKRQSKEASDDRPTL